MYHHIVVPCSVEKAMCILMINLTPEATPERSGTSIHRVIKIRLIWSVY